MSNTLTFLELDLRSTSAKHRIGKLNQLTQTVKQTDLDVPELWSICSLLLETYQSYRDRPSRRAVQSCLGLIATGDHGTRLLPPLISYLEAEATKPTLASSAYFVLTESIASLLSELVNHPLLWLEYSLPLVQTLAISLDKVVSTCRPSVRLSATVQTRRAFRCIFNHPTSAGTSVPLLLAKLCEKASLPTPRNAPLIGIIAGVCEKIPNQKSIFTNHTQLCLNFYTREFLGSRIRLPSYLAEALYDLFANFVTLDDFQTLVVPALERALLRAPEIVLDDLVAPIINALPKSVNLSDILYASLLKPLLTNSASKEPAVRNGALKTLQSLARKSLNEQTNIKILNNVLAPLKENKPLTVQQKVVYASIIASLPAAPSTSTTALEPLGQFTLKEANDLVLNAEVEALAHHMKFTLVQPNGFANGFANKFVDPFTKGLSSKSVISKRIWALHAGGLIWNLTDEQLLLPQVKAFIHNVFINASEILKEASSNTNRAAENGSATAACVLIALSLDKLKNVKNSNLKPLVSPDQFTKAAVDTDSKSAYLINPIVFARLTHVADIQWVIRSLFASLRVIISTSCSQPSFEKACTQTIFYFLLSPTPDSRIRPEATHQLALIYAQYPAKISVMVIDGLWAWLKNFYTGEKDTVAELSKAQPHRLASILSCICLSLAQRDKINCKISPYDLEEQMIQLLVLARSDLIAQTSWIDLCLKVDIDPGKLVEKRIHDCLVQIKTVTTIRKDAFSSRANLAAYSAAVDLVFVNPSVATPSLLSLFRADLDASRLKNVSELEAAIFRTPEGTAFVDVLLKKPNELQPLNKNAKDYDDMKWEQEVRAQLAQKSTPQSKKLNADEQAKIRSQLEKESNIRKQVSEICENLQRGVGIIHALATGPTTQTELWIVQAIDMLQNIIAEGADLLIGDSATNTYLACAQKLSSRLGPLKPFVGVTILRAMSAAQLPEELLSESLQEVTTRILYRLHSLAEQRPFDVVSLAYTLPLILSVLDQGGFAKKHSEEADEQLVLALEFLSMHSTECANELLPRHRVLSYLISTMQRFNQHYKSTKDCLQPLVSSLGPTITALETGILLKAVILPESFVRLSVLQAIDNDLDLSDAEYSQHVWIACHDVVPENAELAQTIWSESGMTVAPESAVFLLGHLESQDRQLRRSAASACAETMRLHPETFAIVLSELKNIYISMAKPRVPEKDVYGMAKRTNLADPWEARSGVALAFKEISRQFDPSELDSFCQFVIEDGPLGDPNDTVRDEMIEAVKEIIQTTGSTKVEELMKIFETALENPHRRTQEFDRANEATIILYGALAGHLKPGDSRIPVVINRLLETLKTPSEAVQEAVAECLPPLIRGLQTDSSDLISQLLENLLQSSSYPIKRGSAYGLAGFIKGSGVSAFRQYRIMASLQSATEAKRDQNQRQGAFLAYELLSYILKGLFEPYVIELVPQLLTGQGDSSSDVRAACYEATKACFTRLSSYGVKKVLPMLLDGLTDMQWRSKKGACESLGAMAHLDPQQLAQNLPQIIPPLANVLNDSHKEVRTAANRSLKRFGEVITNPEIKSVVNVLLKALSDPTKHTEEALDALIKIQFVHYLDASSLALVVRILERGLGDRSLSKRKSSQIIGSLAHLTERKDLIAHLPILIAGLRIAVVDPVPATRATASKAMGSLVEKLGEDALPDLIPSLMNTLKSDTGAGDRLGSAQALSEVLAGLGTARLEETLPTILQNTTSTKPAVREGFMCLFIFLPVCFGNSFSNYLGKIIPPILNGLADEIESIRETALRAGRLLVKNFSNRAIDLLLPSLENGLADDSYRIRLSSVELVGDLLFNLTGIAGKDDADEEDMAEYNAAQAGNSLLEVLGEERRNRVLSAVYICRCDVSGLVRAAAIEVWKALVATPRILREITPALTQLIIARLASPKMEQKVIAGNALGELIRKAGEGVLSTLLPTLDEGLNSTDPQSRQGICIALRDIISSSTSEALEDFEATLVSIVKVALVDFDVHVREAAAEAFDELQNMFGKKAVDQVLPSLLNLLRYPNEAKNALSALLTLLTDRTRSGIILPTLLPSLLATPISSFNAQAIASLADVAGSAMVRRLPLVIHALVNNIVACNDEDRLEDLESALDSVLLSVAENDGLNTMMSVMLALAKDPHHQKRRITNSHFATFLAESEIDFSRYYPDLVRVLLSAFDDSDIEVVRAAWGALNELTKGLRKEDMEELVIPTRIILSGVGVPGAYLPGFGVEKGIGAILPIFLQGLTQGTTEQRIQSALAISDLVNRTSADNLKPFAPTITGPLIRVVSERSVDVRATILSTLHNLLLRIPLFLKPFVPQLQRTFVNALADTSSDVLRTRGAKCLGTLITMVSRVDPLITELVNKAKISPEVGVKVAIVRALYEVVTKAGSDMSELSRKSILGIIDEGVEGNEDKATTINARLLGALIKVLPEDSSQTLIKNRVLVKPPTLSSIYSLNATLVESPTTLVKSFSNETVDVLKFSLKEGNALISVSTVLAVGKLLLSRDEPNPSTVSKSLLETLAAQIAPGKSVDIRRLSLVVVRTLSRRLPEVMRPLVAVFVWPVFGCVRDAVIPVKLAAEQAFVALFDVVKQESRVFDQYMADNGASMQAIQKRGLTDYFKRVVLRLAGQARERKEAEGGVKGTLGLSEDELDDEKEVWSVGRVDMGDGVFE